MILVTAFEPFEGCTVNTSEEVLKLLPESIGCEDLSKVVLSCDSEVTPQKVVDIVGRFHYSSIILLGEDKRYSFSTLETIAYNWLDYDVPDNYGRQPRGRRIDPMANKSLKCVIDGLALQQCLSERGLKLLLSEDPGRHLCNHVYFSVLNHYSSNFVVLLHFPRLQSQQELLSESLHQFTQITLGVLEYLIELGKMRLNEFLNK